MPKFLVEATYTAEGLKGLQKDKASGREAALKQAVQSMGGSLDTMLFALGARDVVALVDLPDTTAAAALGVAASASGLLPVTSSARPRPQSARGKRRLAPSRAAATLRPARSSANACCRRVSAASAASENAVAAFAPSIRRCALNPSSEAAFNTSSAAG